MAVGREVSYTARLEKDLIFLEPIKTKSAATLTGVVSGSSSLSLAVTAAKSGAFRIAQSLLEKDIVEDIDSRLTRYNLALVHFRQGNKNHSHSHALAAANIFENDDRVDRFLCQLLADLGDVDLAITLCSRILAKNSDDVTALCFRGFLLTSCNRVADAIKDYDAAIQLRPDDSELFEQRAICQKYLNRIDFALSDIDQSILLGGENERSLWLKATLEHDAGDYLACARTCRKIVSNCNPTPREWGFIALNLSKLGRKQEADQAFEIALNLGGIDPELNAQFAIHLTQTGREDKSLRYFQTSLQFNPKDVATIINYGVALRSCGELAASKDQFDLALSLDPNNFTAHFNLGVVLNESGSPAEAIKSYDLAIAIDPNSASAHYNRGAALQTMRKFADSLDCYRTTLSLDPTHAGAAWNIGLLHLTQGDYELGFEFYEKRFQNADFKGVYSRRVPFPPLTGDSVTPGTKVLVLHEQGLGDTIQFSRYLREMTARGMDVSVLAPKPLHRLLSSIPGVTRVSQSIDLTDSYDFHCHMMSLAKIFRTTVTNIPFCNQPFLFADEMLVKEWISILKPQGRQQSVGLMWSGGSASKIKGRSMTLVDFQPALIPGIDFISLQKDLSDTDLEMLKATGRIRHFGEQQTDFADAAALISLVDIVVSVDTSIAHLAGALGKETWIMLPFNADWRWLEDRDDSPWYSTVRLFRQKTQDDWSTVIAEIAGALRQRFMTG